MPIIQIPLGLDGPIIDIGLSVPKNYAPWGGPPGKWRGLIDTGSNMTTISPAIVAALQPNIETPLLVSITQLISPVE